MIGFRQGKKQPSSGWLLPVQSGNQKNGQKPQIRKKAAMLFGNVPPYSLVVGGKWSKAVT